MAIFDNTRSSDNNKKMEEFALNLRATWKEFQKEMQDQLASQNKQNKKAIDALKEQNVRSVNGLRQLITSLSHNVLQVVNQASSAGGGYVGSSISVPKVPPGVPVVVVKVETIFENELVHTATGGFLHFLVRWKGRLHSTTT